MFILIYITLSKIEHMARFNTLIINTIKNCFQFFLGVMVYVTLFNSLPNLSAIILGLISFVITYVGVYIYNDLSDYELDKKSKKDFKFLFTSSITKKTASNLMYLSILVGVLMSYLVSSTYLLLILLLVFLNYLYSGPARLKKNYITFSMLISAIEFIKYSLGWASLGGTSANFPFFFILSLALAYASMGYLYKKPYLSDFFIILKDPILIVFLFSGIFYVLSILLYPFKLQLVVLGFLALVILAPTALKKGTYEKSYKLLILGGIVFQMSLIIAFALVLKIQLLAELNQKIAFLINNYFLTFAIK